MTALIYFLTFPFLAIRLSPPKLQQQRDYYSNEIIVNRENDFLHKRWQGPSSLYPTQARAGTIKNPDPPSSIASTAKPSPFKILRLNKSLLVLVLYAKGGPLKGEIDVQKAGRE